MECSLNLFSIDCLGSVDKVDIKPFLGKNLVNEHFQLVVVSLSGGDVHDSLVAIKLLSKVTLAGKKVLADKAYCSEEIRNFISQEKAESCIPDKSNAVVIHNFDKVLCKSRNIIERFLKAYQKLSTRCYTLR